MEAREPHERLRAAGRKAGLEKLVLERVEDEVVDVRTGGIPRRPQQGRDVAGRGRGAAVEAGREDRGLAREEKGGEHGHERLECPGAETARGGGGGGEPGEREQRRPGAGVEDPAHEVAGRGQGAQEAPGHEAEARGVVAHEREARRGVARGALQEERDERGPRGRSPEREQHGQGPPEVELVAQVQLVGRGEDGERGEEGREGPRQDLTRHR